MGPHPDDRAAGGDGTEADVKKAFLSWSSVDRDVVKPLIERIRTNLRTEFYDAFEYESGMNGGDDIEQRVIAEMAASHVIVVFVSAESVSRPWMQTEALGGWLLSRLPGVSTERLILVCLDEIAEGDIPGPIQSSVRMIEIRLDAEDSEAQVARLARDIAAALEIKPPIIVAAAIVAMTRAEFDSLDRSKVFLPQSHHPAQANGGRAVPEISFAQWSELGERYGSTRSDYRPFAGQKMLKDLVERVRLGVNMVRGEDQPPLHIVWTRPEDFPAGPPRNRSSAIKDLLESEAIHCVRRWTVDAPRSAA